MNGRYGLSFVLAAVLFSTVSAAYGQTVLQPTPDPIVTAERTEWYLSGEPITYDGNVYYPVGAPAHFNRYEMVRSGAFRGIPLYVRTTFEPFSIVFLPLAGGMMQPYERRRGGDLAGTVGTTTSAFPVVIPTRSDGSGGSIPQAPSAAVVIDTTPRPEPPPAPAAAAPSGVPGPVGTSGQVVPAPRVAPHRPYQPLIAPRGLDAAYVEFGGARWFQKGRAQSLDALTVTRIGDHHGFPVYATGADATTIYIAVTQDALSLATPFSRRR